MDMENPYGEEGEYMEGEEGEYDDMEMEGEMVSAE